MFEQTVTVYHRVAGPSAQGTATCRDEAACGEPRSGAAQNTEALEHWVRMVIEGVFFAATEGERVSGKGSWSDAGGILLIPFDGHEDRYLPPGEYGAAGGEASGWTIAAGDRVVEGALDYEILRSPSELHAFGRVSTVTSIRPLPFGGLAHWKVWCDGSQY